MNFPDNLFALALLLVVVLLCTARTRMFVAWALLAALLRYPGAVVVGLAVAVLWRVDPARGRGSVEGLARYVLGLGAFCAVMLIVGLLSGQLQPWLWSLYFETVPEHFRNNADALPLLQRPLHFVQLAFFFGCGIFVVGLPPRGTLAKVAAGTALLYMPFLAFIDHFSRHYFLPLIALFGLAASASIAQIPDLRWRRSTAAVALLVAASLLALWRG